MTGPKETSVTRCTLALALMTAVIILPALLIRTARAGVPGTPVILLQDPVKVTVIAGKDDESLQVYSLDITLEAGVNRYRLTSRQPGNSLADAIASQKIDTRWREPYLLIGYDRGGGNASRGYMDVVFSLRKGRLLYLGEVEAPYKGGAFSDTYNKFEMNDLTSHGGAPMFPLVLEEKGGRFRVNLERTWRKSGARFQENASEIQALLRKKPPLSGPHYIALEESLLFNAALARYCQRSKELEEMLKAASIGLQREDPKRFAQFKDIVAQVLPGELPRREVEVVAEGR